MGSIIRAEFYKIRHCRLLWFVPFFFVTMGVFYSAYNFEVFTLYDKLELFVLPTLASDTFCPAVIIMTGYTIGLDFSKKTIQNVISIGVNRNKYFFSRLGVQLLLTALLYIAAVLSYACGRQCFYPAVNVRPNMELFWVKLIVCILVTILQLWAYVSVVNALCYFVKKQLPVMTAGMILIFIELVIRQISGIYGIDLLRDLFDFAPVRVLKNVFEKYAMYDKILTFDFLKYGISALLIIIAGSAAGFIKFRYFPGNDAI